jgi:hypothetical protein
MLECDLKTHSVKRRPMTVARYHNKTFEPMAHFDIGGADFRLV